MDARIWTLAAVAVFFLGLASFTGYFSKLDTAQNALKEAQKELKELEDELEDNAATADSKRAAFEELTTLVAVHDGLIAKTKTLSAEIEDLEGRKSAGLKVFRDTVNEVRSKSVGAPWADVPFRNGQILRQVRIQKVTDTDVTFAHAEGLAKLTADELPADLKDRLRLGMEPFLSLPTATPSTTSTVTSTVKTTPVGGSAAAKGTVEHVEAEINANDAKIISLENTRAQWRGRATSLRYQSDGAKAAGRPTYNLNKEATEAEKQQAAVEQQLSQARLEGDRLRTKLIEARNAFIRARISDSQR